MKTIPPLPQLEAELVAAAARLDGATPRRSRWRHGWVLLSLVLAVTGTSAAVARVIHVGPFSYLSRYTDANPKLAPTSSVSIQPAGTAPAWQALALVNHLGELCMTGGPRDPRRNPRAQSTAKHLNNPPQTDMVCTDSDELAQALVDPHWPGATFADSTPLDGDLQGAGGRITASGLVVRVRRASPTKVLVYGVTEAGVTPVVRWGPKGAPIAMTPAVRHLRLPVDKTPDGLTPQGRKEVAGYPDALDLVFWAAPVDVPPGTGTSQVAFPSEMPPLGVPDNTIDLLSERDLSRTYAEGKKHGWTFVRHITRDPAAVHGVSTAERRWIGALARPRTAADDAPDSLHTTQTGFERIAWPETRLASVVGGGVTGKVWIAPGGLPEDMPATLSEAQACVLGASMLASVGNQCQSNVEHWKQPYVQAVSCSPSLTKHGETLVWGISPPGATGITLSRPGSADRALPVADLVAVKTAVADRPTAITWTFASANPVTVKVPWPSGMPRCGDKSPAYKVIRNDSEGGSNWAGGPRGGMLAPRPPK